jgi:hypothetical protein
MVETTKAELLNAKARGNALANDGIATGVTYDAARNRLIVTLSTGIEVMFNPHQAQAWNTPPPRTSGRPR